MVEPCDTVFIGDLPGELTTDEFNSVFASFGTVLWSKLVKGGKGGKQAALIQFQSVDEATWVVENVNGNIPEGLQTPVIAKYKEDSTKTRQMGPAQAAGGKGGGWKDRGGPYSRNGGNTMQTIQTMPQPVYDPQKGAGKGGKVSCKGIFGARELVDGLYASGAIPGGMKYENDENAIYIAGLPKDTTNETLFLIFSPFGAIAPRGARAMLHPDGGCKGIGFVNFLQPGPAQAAISTLNGAQMPNGTTLIVKTKTGGKGGKA